MQILPINKNFAPSFAAIKSIGNFTEKQTELDIQLKNILNEPHKDLHKTPNKYSEKKGYNFVIKPIGDDKVCLSMQKNMTITLTNGARSYDCTEEIQIGDHDDNNPLRAEDIIHVYNKSHRRNQNMLIGMFCGTVLALSLTLGLSQFKGAKAASIQTVEKIGAMTDSIYNKIASILK